MTNKQECEQLAHQLEARFAAAPAQEKAKLGAFNFAALVEVLMAGTPQVLALIKALLATQNQGPAPGPGPAGGTTPVSPQP
jgi:hypothetical protein